MNVTSNELSKLFQEFAKENSMTEKEIEKELEGRITLDLSEKIASDISYYLDLFMVLPLRREQHKLLMTVMAYLMDDIVNTKFTFEDAVKELKLTYDTLKKKEE